MLRKPKKSPVKKRGLKKTYTLRSSAGDVTYEYGKRKVRMPIVKKPRYVTRPRKIGEERRLLTDSVKKRLGNWGTVTGTARELFVNWGGPAHRKEKTKIPKKKK